MTPGMDPRGRLTRAALHRAILTLIRDKPIAEISVAELCREAAIHRTTFYKHYATVSDFVGQAFADVVDDLIAIPPGSRFSFEETPVVYREAVRRVFTAVLDDRHTYRRLLGPGGDLHFQRAMIDGLTERFTSAAENCLRFTGAPVDPAVAGAAIAGATVMVAERIAHGESEDVEAMIDLWRDTLPGWFADGWGNRTGEALYATGTPA
jgi:AcrR family transcriptional regulator